MVSDHDYFVFPKTAAEQFYGSYDDSDEEQNSGWDTPRLPGDDQNSPTKFDQNSPTKVGQFLPEKVDQISATNVGQISPKKVDQSQTNFSSAKNSELRPLTFKEELERKIAAKQDPKPVLPPPDIPQKPVRIIPLRHTESGKRPFLTRDDEVLLSPSSDAEQKITDDRNLKTSAPGYF